MLVEGVEPTQPEAAVLQTVVLTNRTLLAKLPGLDSNQHDKIQSLAAYRVS